MEYLIIVLIVVGLYIIIPCNFKERVDKWRSDAELDGGVYSGKSPKPKKKRSTRKTATKRKVVKRKTKRKTKTRR